MQSLRRLITLAPLALAALMTLAGPAAAKDSPVLDRILENGVMRVGMSGSQPPFNARSRSGQLIGLEVDLSKQLAGALGVRLEIVEKPFGQLLAALDKGEMDLVMSGMAITPQRTQQFAFVGPYMMSGKSILTKSSTLAAARGSEDINQSQVTLTALENSTSEQFVQRYLKQAQLITVNDYDEGVSMVREGTADAMVADMPICILTTMRYPTEGFVTLSRPMTVEPVGIAISANDRALKNLLDSYLDALARTGYLTELRKQWLQDSSWIAALP